MKVLITKTTWIKSSPVQSIKLSSHQKQLLEKGKTIEDITGDEPAGTHVKIIHKNNSSLRYLFREHIEIEGTEPNNQPKDEPEEPETKISDKLRGRPIRVPELGVVYLGEAIIEGGHFSWAEATKNGKRIPASDAIIKKILETAVALEKIREQFNDRPITINSWYRDPETNRRVGGSSRSRHMSGDAVDFVIKDIPPKTVNAMLARSWGSKGGLASASCFTHIDLRGYRARWTYGF